MFSFYLIVVGSTLTSPHTSVSYTWMTISAELTLKLLLLLMLSRILDVSACNSVQLALILRCLFM